MEVGLILNGWTRCIFRQGKEKSTNDLRKHHHFFFLEKM